MRTNIDSVSCTDDGLPASAPDKHVRCRRHVCVECEFTRSRKEAAQRLLNDSATRLLILQDEMRSARSERRHVGRSDITARPVVLEATPKLAPRPSAKRRWCWNDDPRYAESQRLATERILRGRDVGADNL